MMEGKEVMRHDQRGFSLIELLIVVAIILIIAAIAIPNLLRSRIAANQASSIESLRIINTAQVSYAATYGIGYAGALSYLGPPATGAADGPNGAGLIDSVLAGVGNISTKSGYNFTYAPNKLDGNGHYQGFEINADPISYGVSGSAYYYTDETFVIRGNITQVASSTDSSVAQ